MTYLFKLHSIVGYSIPTKRNTPYAKAIIKACPDENITFTDYEGDVWYLEWGYLDWGFTDEKPNIDITSGRYYREREEITLTLEVKGVIENRVDVEYSFKLGTFNNNCFCIVYEIVYINGTCMFDYPSSMNLSSVSVHGSTLSVSFEVENAIYPFDDLIIGTIDKNKSNDWQYNVWYYDYATPDINSLDAEIIKPEKALYINNKEIFSFPTTVIFGNVDVLMASLGGMIGLELYIDGELKNKSVVSFNSMSCCVGWDEWSFGRHTAKVVAYDMFGNTDTEELIVWKFF